MGRDFGGGGIGFVLRGSLSIGLSAGVGAGVGDMPVKKEPVWNGGQFGYGESSA